MSQPLVSGVYTCLVDERLHVDSVHKTGWGHNCLVHSVCKLHYSFFTFVCIK